MTTRIKVILGSTRQKRFGDKPAYWICEEARALRTSRSSAWTCATTRCRSSTNRCPRCGASGSYNNAAVQRWADRIADGHAFVVVTPEYNHGYPAVLKNAIDSIYPEWVNKPIGFVSYGNTGGARAIEQLRQVAIEMRMWPMRAAIHIPPPSISR